LEYIAKRDNIEILHAKNKGEYHMPGSRYKADGYCESTNTIYEFNGCLYHGCPVCYNKNDINPIINKQNKELYKKTIKKNNFIISAGYKLICIWEHDLNYFLNDNIIIDNLTDDLSAILFLIADNINKYVTSNEISLYLLLVNINPNNLIREFTKEFDLELLKLLKHACTHLFFVNNLLQLFRNFYLDKNPNEIISI
jgi:hypothetical protein